MYANRATNSYCARYVHIFLDKANDFERLVQIALDEKIDNSDIGLVQVNQAMKHRIQFALKRSEMKIAQNQLLACKLVYRLFDYNAKEDALNEFIQKENPQIQDMQYQVALTSCHGNLEYSFSCLIVYS